MSKAKQHPAPTKRGSPWVSVGIAIGLIVAVAAVAAAILSANRGEPVDAEVAGAPSATFDQTRIDHGRVAFEQPVESVFTVRNVGDQPLQIVGEPRVELVAGC